MCGGEAGEGLIAKRLAGQFEAWLEAFLAEPALVHLQHIAHRLERAVGVGGLWLHVFQVDDGSVVGNERCRQGQKGVFHPETLFAGVREDKQHALALGHVGPVHQSDLVLLWRHGDLNVHLVDACRQGDALQLGLRCFLGPGVAAPAEGE